MAFLCSEKSSWLTGEVLDLNGGAHLKRYPNIHAHLTKLMGNEFAGKTAVVTGGGSGIGAALCRALVGAGADVLCTDIDRRPLPRLPPRPGVRAARGPRVAWTSPTRPPCRRRSTTSSRGPAAWT